MHKLLLDDTEREKPFAKKSRTGQVHQEALKDT